MVNYISELYLSFASIALLVLEAIGAFFGVLVYEIYSWQNKKLNGTSIPKFKFQNVPVKRIIFLSVELVSCWDHCFDVFERIHRCNSTTRCHHIYTFWKSLFCFGFYLCNGSRQKSERTGNISYKPCSVSDNSLGSVAKNSF